MNEKILNVNIFTEKGYAFEFVLSQIDVGAVFGIDVYDNDTREKIANSFFRIHKENHSSRSPICCTLGNIEIINKEYSNKGICSEVLKLMEYFSFRHYASSVVGKFYPHGEEMNTVLKFYEKNGYSVDMFEKEIYKKLEYSNIVKPNFVGKQIEYTDINDDLCI